MAEVGPFYHINVLVLSYNCVLTKPDCCEVSVLSLVKESSHVRWCKAE